MSRTSVFRVLFVCTGNICRSPTAEGVFRRDIGAAQLGDRIMADSAGTSGWHEGEPPDARARAAARTRGVDLGHMRARKVRRRDFDQFDLMLAMDRGHLQWLERKRPDSALCRVGLFLDYAQHVGARDVPDPYYGDTTDFDEVLDLVEVASLGLVDVLAKDLRRAPIG